MRVGITKEPCNPYHTMVIKAIKLNFKLNFDWNKVGCENNDSNFTNRDDIP